MNKWLQVISVLLLMQSAAKCAEIVDEDNEKIFFMSPGAIIDFKPNSRHRGFFENDLRTYCHRGKQKSLRSYFETVALELAIDGDDYTQYEGATPTEVREHYDERRSLFSLSLFSQKRTRLELPPFEQKCIGIETVQPYRISLHQRRIDVWRLLLLVLGVVFFVYGGTLSQNAIFYYIIGVVLGICLSFMLLIWLTSKLIPRRPMMYGVLVGGWAIGAYIIKILWVNLQLIVLTYSTYVFYYILVTGLVSFFLCYRLGPPKDNRSKQIVKWVLQLMSLLLIYLSSSYNEATFVVMFLTMVTHYFPHSAMNKMRSWYMRQFPPKRRLLTVEEFEAQASVETAKALQELRTFASSPECKQWKVMTKLRDPLRFASFVEGEDHVREDELMHHENSKYSDELDESDPCLDDDEEEEEYVSSPQRSDTSFVSRRVHYVHPLERSLGSQYDGELNRSRGYNSGQNTPVLNGLRRANATPSPSPATLARRRERAAAAELNYQRRYPETWTTSAGGSPAGSRGREDKIFTRSGGYRE